MMKQRARIETAFEIARVLVFGGSWRDCAAGCCECGSYVPMVSLPTAATLDKTTNAAIFRRVEAGELHHRLTASGALSVCLSSLLDAGHLSCAETADKSF